MGKVGVAGLTTTRIGVRGVKICTPVFLVTLTPNEPKSTKKSICTIKSYGSSYPDRADHTILLPTIFAPQWVVYVSQVLLGLFKNCKRSYDLNKRLNKNY